MNYIIVTNSIGRDVKLVEKSLRSSLSQSPAPKKVIFLDQNRLTLNLSKEVENNSLLEIVNVSKKSVSGARNCVKIPDDIDWVIFCDDDGHLESCYSKKLSDYILKNPEIEIMAGSILREDTMDYYSLRHKVGGSLTKFRNSKNLMGSNFVVKAKVFDDLKRFDEEFGAGAKWGSGEETDFCWKAYFSDKKMEYVPELKVIHIPPFNESLIHGLQKSYRYGVGKGALVAKWIFRKRKILVFYEFFEMLFIPIIQIFRGFFTFKFGLIPNSFATIIGRVVGMLKYVMGF